MTKILKKILVVDDSSLDRKRMIEAIRNVQITHEILQANNGEEALAVLAKNYQEIGLILLDWQMPRMDGLEFMKGVIKVPQTASIPIVMVTASGSQEAQDCARDVNPNLAGYIIKPYDPADLISTISSHLKSFL